MIRKPIVPFDAELPRSASVPLLPFLPASAVYSAHRLAGLLHPATDHGVRHVSESRFRLPLSQQFRPEGPSCQLPLELSLPKERHSHGIDHPVPEDTADRTTLPVPVRPKTHLHSVSASGFPSPKGSEPRPCDLRVRDPFPMAFHPSKLFPQHQPYPVTPVSRVHQRPLPSRRFPARHLPVHLPPKR